MESRALGFTANAMCVWDVPGAEADALGEALASEPHLRVEGVFTHFASAEGFALPIAPPASQVSSVDRSLGEMVPPGGMGRILSFKRTLASSKTFIVGCVTAGLCRSA